MSRFKFLHAADLHLDSPLRGLGKYEDAPLDQLRGASRRALERAVDLALSQAVDFVVLAGDLFDGDWKDYSTGIFLNRQLARLTCPIFLLSGNHDAESVVTRQLQWPEHVQRFDVYQPETRRLEHLKVALHGQGFAERVENRNLVQAYPEGVPGWFNLGVLHTSADGREGHESYAPCSLAHLQAKGYQYWALGHVHEPEVLCQEPWVIFPGCLQGRHARECGPRGCYLVEVNDHQVSSATFHSLDVVRWEHLQIDCSGLPDLPSLMRAVEGALDEAERVCSAPLLAVRLTLSGRTSAHHALVSRSDAVRGEIRNQAGQRQRVWLEKVRFETRPELNVGELLRENPALESLVSALGQLRDDAEVREQLLAPVRGLHEKLPPALKERFLSAEQVEQATRDVRDLIWANLEAR